MQANHLLAQTRLLTMIVLTSLVALAAFWTPQADDSLLAKIVPTPTGKNGYEDYLRAADAAGNLWSKYESWLSYKIRVRPVDRFNGEDLPDRPPVPPGVSEEMSDLAIRKVANDRFAGICAIMELGNQKPIRDPRSGYSTDTMFPEFSRFKILAKICSNKAHIEFSEGRSGLAVRDLLEGLKFSKGVLGTTMISTLVSVAIQAIILSEFNEHLGQICLSDALLIEKTCRSLINTPLPISDVFKHEYEINVSALDRIFDNPRDVLSEDVSDVFGSAIKGLNGPDRLKAKEFVANSLYDRYSEAAANLAGPESGWNLRDGRTDPPVSREDKSASNLALAIIKDLFGRAGKTQYSRALAKGNVQLRLLLLHALLLEFHWQKNRWPTQIEEFADGKDSIDPFAGESYHYEIKDRSYRLYSTGIPGIGPVELKYRAQPMPETTASEHPLN